MSTRIKNPTNVPLSVSIQGGTGEYTITILPRQTAVIKPGHCISPSSLSRYPQLKVIEDTPAPTPVPVVASVPPKPVETKVREPEVAAEEKPSTTKVIKVVDKNSEKGGDR